MDAKKSANGWKMASDKYTISAIIKVFDEATGPLKKVGAGLGGLGAQMGRAGEKMNQWGNTLSTRVTLPLVGFATLAVRAFDQSEKAIAGVRQGIISTGSAAGKTVEDLTKLATQMEKKTLFGDDEILAGATAQLLTFTNIAGKEFDRTQQAALDVATKISMTSGGTKDLTGTAIMLGKALNDPVSNLGALSRSGIQFSDDQKKVIKTLWETGKRAEAQRVILAELEKQYGGTAEAAAKAGLGPMQQFMNQLNNTMEVIGGKLLPILVKLTEKLSSALEWFDGLDDSTKDFLITTAMIIAAIGPVLKVMGSLISIIKDARDVTLLFNAALWANPLTWIVLGIAALSYALYELIFNFEEVRQGAISAWDAVAGFMNAKFGEGTMTRVASMENRVAMPDLGLGDAASRRIARKPGASFDIGKSIAMPDLGLGEETKIQGQRKSSPSFDIGKSIAGAKKSTTQTDINISVSAKDGSEAKVDKVQQKGSGGGGLDQRTGTLKVYTKPTGIRG